MKIHGAHSLHGTVRLPGDKSISHRAAILAAMATGETRVENFSTAEDCQATLACLRKMGVAVSNDGSNVGISGVGKTGFSRPDETLDCGNSGTTARLLAGVLAGQAFDSQLTGDASMLTRPMNRIVDPLRWMGAKMESDNGRLPIVIRGGQSLRGVNHEMKVASAQVKSCLLLAGLLADGRTAVIENIPTRDHTERMLGWFGVEVESTESTSGKIISVSGKAVLQAHDLQVPSDISSAAFFIVAAACLEGSQLVIPNICLNPTRAAIIEVLRGVGAHIEMFSEEDRCGEPNGSIRVRGGLAETTDDFHGCLSGNIIPSIIDEIPVLAVLGTQLARGLEIRDAGELRLKESDRISAIVQNLGRMGAVVCEFDDGFRVERSMLRGGRVASFGDHRIAMAFTIAGLLATGETQIDGAECVNISFPGFFDILAGLVRGA